MQQALFFVGAISKCALSRRLISSETGRPTFLFGVIECLLLCYEQ